MSSSDDDELSFIGTYESEKNYERDLGEEGERALILGKVDERTWSGFLPQIWQKYRAWIFAGQHGLQKLLLLIPVSQWTIQQLETFRYLSFDSWRRKMDS